MRTALFVSPHLDDVAFSCGGTLLRLVDAGWRVALLTIFTASVPDPKGFALRCQTDKGIPPTDDYMALRREEDLRYAALSGVARAWYWSFREAPHRGYESPAALFAGELPGDEIWRRIADELRTLLERFAPDVIFAPQGLGNHVDHLQTIRAVLDAGGVERVAWYRDTPYAIREPAAQPSPLLPTTDLLQARVPITGAVLARKIDGCCQYASQLPFQFGGTAGVRDKLLAFHHAEAGPGEPPGVYAEVFSTSQALLSSFDHDFFLAPSH